MAEDGEALVTKFVLCGGAIWDASVEYPKQVRCFALSPADTDPMSCLIYGEGLTPLQAVQEYIGKYGAPWETPPGARYLRT